MKIKSVDEAIAFIKVKLNQPLIVVALIAVGIVCLGLFGWLFDRLERARPTTYTISEIRPPAHTTTETKSDPAQAVSRFREKIMSIPESKQMIAGIEPGASRGVVRIQVTSLWFDMKPHQKRQVVQMMANTWRADAGTDTVIVHIYDFTGREVASMSAFGNIWIEDE